MRSYTIILSCVILATFFVRSSDAVACSATILTNCTDCSDGANADDDDCTTTTTTTTETSVTLAPNRRIVRLSNLRYTNIRRVRVNRNGTGAGVGTGISTGTGTRTRNTRNNRRANRRSNNRNRRGRNIRILRG